MAVGTAPTDPSSQESYIEQQLLRTQRQVKINDLLSGLLTLAIGSLSWLLLVALVDHWMFDLGFAGRLVALLVLVVAIGLFMVRQLMPLIMRKINPAFAARMIEQGQPALKNSLLNFLFLRGDQHAVHGAVMAQVRQQAAVGLTHVPPESLVDRDKLIRTGYAFAAVFAVFALYVMVSPKSTAQTVSRIAVPWSDVARPARVEIREIDPGDLEVFFGSRQLVRALIGNSDDDDAVTIVFSTDDQQIVNQVVEMEEQVGGWFATSLPPGDEGFQQSLTYHIEAGDAVSREYRLEVIPAPTIIVQRVDYAFPRYTRRAPQSVADQGDIRALEGTRVTIHARSNVPMQSAYIEFDPEVEQPTEPSRARLASVPMSVDGLDATGSFVLQLDADRKSPAHNAYQVRLVVDGDGRKNIHPIVHRIEVIPDLQPEVEILAPVESRLQVPVDSRLPFALRAVDPDYGLTDVTVKAAQGGNALIDRHLFQDPLGQPGQATVKYTFVPRDLKLSPGDEVLLWAEAADNRTSPQTAQPEPNRGRTPNYRITITPASDPENTRSDPSQPDESATEDGENGENGAGENVQGAEGSGEGSPQREGDDGGGESSNEAAGNADDGSSGAEGSASEGQEGGEGSQQSSGEENGEGTPSDPSGVGSPDGTQRGDGSPSGQPGDGDGEFSEEERTEPLHDGEVIERTLEHLQNHPTATTDQEGVGQSIPDSDQRDAASGNDEGDASAAGGESSSETGSEPRPDAEGNLNGEPTDQRGQPQKNEPNPPNETETGDDANAGAGKQSEAGAGKQGDQPESPPPAEGQNRDKPKNSDPGPNDQSGEPNEPQTPSYAPRQSDSNNGNDGDRSGGGERGGGQNANQPGTDSAGSNTSADEGAGQSNERGEGDSGGAGDQQQSDGRGGTTGSEAGAGSGQAENPQGAESGGSPSSDGAAGGPQPRTTPHSNPRKQSTTGSGQVVGGGSPGAGNSATGDGQPTSDIPDAEKERLEYSRQATSLVLEYLKDQQDKPDPELLKKLDWSAEDMREFLKKWEQLERDAENDPASRRRLDNALRGLGLSPGRGGTRQTDVTQDRRGGLRTRGYKSEPPAEYAEQFDAFKKGTSRSRP